MVDFLYLDVSVLGLHTATWRVEVIVDVTAAERGLHWMISFEILTVSVRAFIAFRFPVFATWDHVVGAIGA